MNLGVTPGFADLDWLASRQWQPASFSCPAYFSQIWCLAPWHLSFLRGGEYGGMTTRLRCHRSAGILISLVLADEQPVACGT